MEANRTLQRRARMAPGGPTSRPIVEGSEVQWLFRGDSLEIVRWSCLVTDARLTPERQMPWDEVTFAHTGMFRLHAGGTSHLIDGTSVALLGAGIPFRTSHPLGCGDGGTSFVVRSDLLPSLLAHRHGDPGRFRDASAPCSSRVLVSQRQLVRMLERQWPIEPLQIEEEALAILGQVLGPAHPPGSAGGSRRLPGRDAIETSEAAREHIASRYTRRLRLQEIAAACDVSVYRLCRAFLAATSMTVHRYVSRLRLVAALEKLAAGERDLTALALDLGFSSHSHFSWAFRREFGLSPSDWRSLRGWPPALGYTAAVISA